MHGKLGLDEGFLNEELSQNRLFDASKMTSETHGSDRIIEVMGANENRTRCPSLISLFCNWHLKVLSVR